MMKRSDATTIAPVLKGSVSSARKEGSNMRTHDVKLIRARGKSQSTRKRSLENLLTTLTEGSAKRQTRATSLSPCQSPPPQSSPAAR